LFGDKIIVVRSSGSERNVHNFPAFNAAWFSARQRNIRAVCCCGVSGEFDLAISFQLPGGVFLRLPWSLTVKHGGGKRRASAIFLAGRFGRLALKSERLARRDDDAANRQQSNVSPTGKAAAGHEMPARVAILKK
jgi:hypothetical protein